jgi:protoporphyrinogen/coproporphyrinogen III oxidase
VKVVVVGGGIAGLAAAHELVATGGVDVTVLEASDRLGGKVRTEPFAGVPLDAAPDAFLARRPEAMQLCEELGLTDRLVPPATGEAWVWTRGRLRRLPTGLVLGLPTDPVALARSGVLTPLGSARAAVEPWLPGATLAGDVTIGSVVRRRLGAEVQERLIDPLLGGINAGDTDDLSIDAVAPQLAAAARRSRSIVRGARALTATGPGAPTGPVFYGLPGGMEELVRALTRRLEAAGVELCTGAAVTSLAAGGSGRWRVGTADGEVHDADGVVLAAPAFVTAPLLGEVAPEVGATLDAISYASVTLVALAYPADAVPGPLEGSGFLVPRSEGRLMTACSWASSKWAHLGTTGQVLLRVSAGRAGDTRADALDDDALVERLRVELEAAMGLRAEPTEVRVTRWPRAFPQYAPGHLDRMTAAMAALGRAAPGVTLAGAALGGVGLPACIGSGRTAASDVLEAAGGR